MPNVMMLRRKKAFDYANRFVLSTPCLTSWIEWLTSDNSWDNVYRAGCFKHDSTAVENQNALMIFDASTICSFINLI
jgi:hypothetical protein